MKDIVIPQEIPSGMTQEDARKEITVLHDVLRHGGLRPDWSRSSLDGHSPGVFYDIGPLQTKGLTVVQYYELVRLAKAGLLAEGSAQLAYPVLKILRALVEGGRDMLLINGSKATLELDSLREKLDAAARRYKQREYRELKERR